MDLDAYIEKLVRMPFLKPKLSRLDKRIGLSKEQLKEKIEISRVATLIDLWHKKRMAKEIKQELKAKKLNEGIMRLELTSLKQGKTVKFDFSDEPTKAPPGKTNACQFKYIEFFNRNKAAVAKQRQADEDRLFRINQQKVQEGLQAFTKVREEQEEQERVDLMLREWKRLQ